MADGDPAISVNTNDHDATSVFAVWFCAPVPEPTYRRPFFAVAIS